MYYELYIDVFFTVNFTMDYILLVAVRKMLKCPARHGRIALGALLGSALTCLVIILPVPYTFVKFVLFHGMVNVLMIRAGLLVKWGSDMLRAWILLYISGFLTGGVFQFLGQYMRIGSLFFVLAVASYYAVSGIWSLISYLSRQNQYRCQAELYMNGRKCQVQALIDTGNSLRDELTGKPVCILDQDVARELLAGSEAVKLRYIPYHSIGKKDGVMPLVTLDKMCIRNDKKQWIAEPMVAICENEMTADKYKMIINPEILVGGIDDDDKSSSTASI